MPTDVQVQNDADSRVTGASEKVLTLQGDCKVTLELSHNGWSLLEGVSRRRATNKHWQHEECSNRLWSWCCALAEKGAKANPQAARTGDCDGPRGHTGAGCPHRRRDRKDVSLQDVECSRLGRLCGRRPKSLGNSKQHSEQVLCPSGVSEGPATSRLVGILVRTQQGQRTTTCAAEVYGFQRTAAAVCRSIVVLVPADAGK